MIVNVLALLSTGAVVANAFQPTAGVEVALDHGVNPKSQLIDLPCLSCALPFSSEDSSFTASHNDRLGSQHPESETITLLFTISDQDQQLRVNGTTIFPFNDAGDSDDHIFHIGRNPGSIATADASIDRAPSSPASQDPISFIAHFRDQPSPFETGDELIPIEIAMTGWRGQFDEQRSIAVDLLRLDDGELLLLRVSTTPGPHNRHHSHWHPSPFADDETKCRLPSAVCKFGSIVAAKMGMLHGSAERRPAPSPHGNHPGPHHPHGTPMDNAEKSELELNADEPEHSTAFPPSSITSTPSSSSSSSSPPSSQAISPTKSLNPFKLVIRPTAPAPPPKFRLGRPHHSRPYSRHHRHHHTRHALHALARGLIAVLIPVAAGVTVGLLVSLVGLMAGRFVTFVWVRLVRGGRRRGGGRGRGRGRAWSGLSASTRQRRRLSWSCCDNCDDCDDDEDYEDENGDERDASVAGYYSYYYYYDDACEMRRFKHDEPLPIYEEAPAYEAAPAYEDVVGTRWQR